MAVITRYLQMSSVFLVTPSKMLMVKVNRSE